MKNYYPPITAFINRKSTVMSLRSIVTFLALMVLASVSKAQTVQSSYTQAKATGATFLNPGTTTTLFSTGSWSGSTATPAAVTIPFTFNFLGTNYTTCYVNPNGYVTFGATSTGTNYTPLSVHDAGVAGIIAGLAVGPLSGSTPPQYGVTGSAPSRVFSIIWTSAVPAGLSNSAITFEINLYETTNKAEVIYSTSTRGATAATVTAQVGIGGSSNTDYLNWTEGASSTTTTAGGATGTNWVLLKPGIVNNATCTILRTNAAYFPATNLSLSWTPSLTLYSPSDITNTGFTMNWQPAAGATSYNVELSSSNTFASYVSGYPATVASTDTFKVATGLTTGTKYYYRVKPVYAVSGFLSISNTYPITMPVAVPLSLTPSSFTYDIIANGGNLPVGSTAANGSTNNFPTYNGLDHGGWDLASADFYNVAATNGLPIGGSLTENTSNGIVYQIAPYFRNNVLWFASGSSTGAGTMTLTTPVAMSTIYAAALSGSGANTLTYTVNFADAGTPQVFSGQTVNDWCSGTSAIIATITRANTNESVANCPFLYRNTLALSAANASRLVSSITVQCTGGTGTYPAIVAISGQKTGILTTSATTLSAFTATSCSPTTTSQSFTLTGSNLANTTANATGTGNILITAPLGFKVSTDNVAFSKMVNVAYTNCAIATTTLYARLDTTAVGSYTGSITFSGGSVPATLLPTIAVSGLVGGVALKPASTTTYPASRGTINFGLVNLGTTSSILVDSLQGFGLTGNISVTSTNTDFQYSLDGVSFGNSVTITVSGSSVTPSIPFYTRVTPTILGADVATLTMSGGTPACTYTFKDSVNSVSPCGNPSLPTAMVFSGSTATGVTVGFTPTGSADGYLLLRGTTAFSGSPANGTDYAVTNTIGTGTVIGKFNTPPPYTVTGLTGNTVYYYTVIPFNGGNLGATCSGGPLYPSGTQLSSSSTSCVATPGTPTASNNTSTSLVASWAASSGGSASAVTYSVEVSTSNTFASGIFGSPFVTSGTSLTLTGLMSNTTYYIRVTAIGLCNSAVSGTLTTSTIENYNTITISSGFNGDGVANGTGNPATVSQSYGTPAFDGANYSLVASDFSYGGFTATTGSLPASGLISSAITSGLTWQLASYSGNNMLRLPGFSVGTGTLTFATPQYASSLYVTATASNNGVTISTTTVTYEDNSTETFGSWALPDWFSTTNRAVLGIGRIIVTTGAPSGTAGVNPSLFQNILANTTYNKRVTSIGFTTSGGTAANSYIGIMAVSAKSGVLNTSATSLSAFANTTTGCTSSSQSFQINGGTLFPSGATIVAKAPSGFQVSNDNATWDTVANFTATGNIISGSTVYVRFKPTALGLVSGNVTFSGGTINTSPTVAVSGTGIGVAFTPTTTAAFGPVSVATISPAITYTVTGTSITAGTITVTSSNPDFQVSSDSTTWGTSYSVANGTSYSGLLYIRFIPSSVVSESATISITGGAIPCAIPTIAATGLGTTPCINPSNPTTLTFTGVTSTSATVGFTPVGAADGYLLVRSYTAFSGGSDPVSGHAYVVNDTLGNGRVIGFYNTAPPYTVSSLVGNTSYYFTVIPFNGGVVGGTCSGGPLYPSGSPLSGNIITCPSAPSISSTSATASTITVNWASILGGSAYSSVNYSVDIALDNAFTMPVAGSPFVVSSPATSLTATSIPGGGVYYCRIKGITSGCTTAYGPTVSVTTSAYCIPTWTAGCSQWRVYSMNTTGISFTGTCGSSPDQSATIDTMIAGVGKPHTIVAGQYLTVGVWVDLNNNGSFLDAGEMIYSEFINAGPSSTYSPTLVIPTGTTAGYHRMRVLASWPSITTPCAAYSGAGGGNYYDFTVYVKVPVLNTSVTSLPAFSSTATCSSSTSQNFSINSILLAPASGTIVAHAPTGFQVSSNGSTWDTTASFAYSGSALSSTTVYVRFSPMSVGSIAGNVSFTGGGIVTTNVGVSGVGNGLTLSSTAVAAFGPIDISTVSPAQTYSLTGSGLVSGSVTIATSNPDFQVSPDNVTYYTSNYNFSSGTSLSSTPIYIKFTPTSLGAQTAVITITGSTGCTLTFTATGFGSNPCSAPAVPSSITFTGTTASGTSVGFTPAAGVDGYLVIRSYTAFAGGSDPISAHTYALNDTFGNGKVVGVYSSLSPYAFVGLNANTTYYYTVIPFNGGASGTCSAGPLYPAGTQLSGSVITCPGAPGAPTASSATSGGFVINWTAPSGGSASAINYIVEVASDTGFTAPVTGSPFTVAEPTTTLLVGGLSATTTYYFRVKASGSCIGAASSTGSGTTTLYDYTTVTLTSGSFNQDVIAEGTANPTVSTTTDFDGASYAFISQTYNYAGNVPSGTNYLPASGAFTSAATTGLPFQLASYAGNNTLRLTTTQTGTLTFATPQYASQLYFLASSGSGAASNVIFTVNYEDGSTDVLNASIADWYGGSPIAIGNVGRVNRGTGGVDAAASTGPNFYQYNLPVSSANYTKRILNVGVNYNGTGGVVNVAAISKLGGIMFASTNVLSAFPATNVGCSSAAQSFTINGSSLYPTGGNITATAPTGFQVSADGTTWGTTATFTYVANNLSTRTVYVRYTPIVAGAASGNVTFSGGTANNTPVIAVSGSATTITVAASGSAPAFCSTGASVTLTATGGSTYTWSPAAGLSVTTGATVSASPTATTTYTVTGYNATGCTFSTGTVTVLYNTPTVPVTGPSSTLCLPGVMALTEGGIGGTWSSSDNSVATVSSVGIVYGVSAAPVTITYSNPTCGGDATYAITVASGGFAVGVSPSSGTYCSTGSSLTVTASGATSYSWYPSAGLDVTAGAVVHASPGASTVYTVVGTTGACSNATTITVWNTTPGAITGGVTSLCPTITNATTWSDTTASGTWTISSGGVATITSGGAITALTVGSATVTYTGAPGCYVTRALTVNPLPVLSATPSAAMVCGGVSVTLTATGASTYSWTPSASLSSGVGSSVSATPTTATTYTITGTTTFGCVSTLTKNVTVGPGVYAAAAVGSASVCPGGSTTLSSSATTSSGTNYAVNAATYGLTAFTSSGSVTGDDVYSGGISIPFTFNFYGVNYTQVNINTNGIVSFSNLAASSGGNLTNYACPSASLLGETGTGIAFGNHDFNASGSMITYGSTGTAPNRKFIIYYNGLAGFSGTGTMTGQLILNENASIDFMITSLVSGTSTYSSTFGLQSGTGTVGLAAPGRSSIGSATTLTNEGWHFAPVLASGNYAWSPATGLSSSVVSGPTATLSASTVYTVTITDPSSGCFGTATASVGVYTSPTVAITSPAIGCAGTAMTAAGASTYTWAPVSGLNATTGATVTPNASVTGTPVYTVTGTDAHACTATATLAVNPVPVLSVTAASAICNGGSATLTASGANTYSWTNSASLNSSTNAAVTATPATTTTYSVSGVSLAGCSSLVSPGRTITVNAIPVAGALTSPSGYCIGSGTSFTITTGTATGTGTLSSYNWSGPATFSTTTAAPSVSFTPATTAASGVYSLTVTYPGSGCTSNPVTTGTVTVADYPVVYNLTGGSGCSGTGLVLGVDGSQNSSYSYALKRGATTVAVMSGTTTSLSYASVSTAGTYSVVATGPAGCQSNMAGTSIINTTPSASVSTAMPNICQPTSSASVGLSSIAGAPSTYSVTWNAIAHSDGLFSDITAAPLTGSSVTLNFNPAGGAGSFDGSLSFSNGACTSVPYPVHVIVHATPAVSVAAVNPPCIGHAGSIDFAGTDSTTVAYSIDGGTPTSFLFAGTTYNLGTGVVTTPHNYLIIDAHNAVCTTAVGTTVTINPVPMAWVGGTGGAGHESDWSIGTNWTCGFAPTATDDVLITSVISGFDPAIPTSFTATTRNLTINSGGVLVIDGTGKVQVGGSYTNTNYVHGAGKVVLNGTAAQRVSGIGTTNNLELSNANGATVDTGSRLIIGSTLTLSAGTLHTNDSVELASTDTNATARIAEIPAGLAAISGKVKVDQYVMGGYRRYRFWSHPFSDTMSLTKLQPYVDITGNGGAANGFVTTGSNAPSAFRLNPYLSNSSMGIDPGWKPFLKINGTADTNKLHPGQGIRLFFRGAKGEGLDYVGYYGLYTPSSSVVKMMGNVNQGNVSIPLAQGADSAVQSFNMVGNPYPSPVDMGTVLWNARAAGQVSGAAFYVFDPALGVSGNFVTVGLGVGSPIPYYVQANTAIQVRADHNGAHIDFTEADKSAATSNYLFKAPVQYTDLSIYDEKYHKWDVLKFNFDDKATDQEDKMLDAAKPMGVSDFNFYSTSADNRKLSIDSRPFAEEKVIPLGITSGYLQNFIIRADNVVVPAGGKLVLHDKLLEKYVEMKAGTEYAFTIGKDKSTQGSDRFELAMKSDVPAAVKPLAVSMTPNPTTDDVKISFTSGKKEKVTVRVMDISGVSIFNQDLGEQQNGTISVPLSTFAAGIYMVELTQGQQKVTQRLVKE